MPEISATDNGFAAAASVSQFVPTSAPGVFKAPRDLFDPAEPELVSLLDEGAFPASFLKGTESCQTSDCGHPVSPGLQFLLGC